MKDFRIHNLPAVTHVWGQPLAEPLPARFGLTLICSRGLRWDGGEFATRGEAVAEGERRTARRAA